MKPLTVVQFTNSSERGGAEEHILTLLRGLDRTRFRPHLVAPPRLLEKLSPDLPGDVEAIPLVLRRPHQIAAGWRLRSLLRARAADVLHSHLFYSSLFASPVGRLAGVPVVVETPHIRELWRTGFLKRHHFVDRLVARCVDRYIAVSQANARYLVDGKRLPPSKVVVIHNGSDLRRFDPGHTAPPSLRPSLGFGPDDPILVLLARLEPQKGHRVMLEALPRVLERFPTARLVCLGDGALRQELEALSRARGLQAAVRFPGFRPEVEDWLALATLTVLPSFFEGLPLAAMESLAAGRPVVASAVDGTPEVVVDGRTGLTVPPGDAGALAAAILRLLEAPAWARQLGVAGRAFVERHFAQERQVRATEELYVDAWSRRTRADERGVGAPAVHHAGGRR